MGQTLFYPPNVAGWPGGANWLTSGTMIARQNFCWRACVNSQTIAASSWLRATAGAIAQAAARATRLRRFCRAMRRPSVAPSSTTSSSGAGTSALAALSVENYDERVSGAAYLAMAMPAYPTELIIR